MSDIHFEGNRRKYMKRKRNVYWTLILCIIIAAVVFPFSVNNAGYPVKERSVYGG